MSGIDMVFELPMRDGNNTPRSDPRDKPKVFELPMRDGNGTGSEK